MLIAVILGSMPFTQTTSCSLDIMMSTSWTISRGRLTLRQDVQKSLIKLTFLITKNPASLHRFEYFQLVRDHAEFYNPEQKDMKRAFSGEGAWNLGNDVDPKLADDDESPTHGKLCDSMTYFDFNPTMINKWDQLSRMDHPTSGSHCFYEWLGFPKGYIAVVESDRHLNEDIVALRGTSWS